MRWFSPCPPLPGYRGKVFGKCWQPATQDLTVLSIAANDKEMSFSSDTGMAECLVIARKLKLGEAKTQRAHFTSLTHRPQGFAEASSIARQVIGVSPVRRIEDGPYGGTPLRVGNESSGYMQTAISDVSGESWGAVRLSDYSLAQTAYALSDSRLWLPGSYTAVEFNVAPLGSVGQLGLVLATSPVLHLGDRLTKWIQVKPPLTPVCGTTMLSNEKRIVCKPDLQLQVREGMEAKAAAVWATASRAHVRDFTFGSQPLAVAFTEQESAGGRVWPNVIFDDKRFDYAFSVWGNSTLGLLSYWWHSSRQQSSAGWYDWKRSAETLPVLDFRALSDEQLYTAEVIFEEFRDRELQPAYLADADPNRALLDRRVVCDLLGFDEDVYESVRRLAAKWCAEPSVHGGKARPKGAVLVI